MNTGRRKAKMSVRSKAAKLLVLKKAFIHTCNEDYMR